MIKVEFVADVSSTAGYAAHARLMLRAFDEVGLEKYDIDLAVTPRQKDDSVAVVTPVAQKAMSKYCQPKFAIPDVRVFFEPAQWAHFDGIPTVLFSQWETTGIRSHAKGGDHRQNWVQQLNQARVVMTSCHDAKVAFEDSGVTTPINVVGGPIFPHTAVGELAILDVTCDEGGVAIPKASRPPVIGYMAQWSSRKHIEAFVRDVVLGFDRGQAIGVLKTYYGRDFSKSREVNEMVSKIVASCRKPKPADIVVITNQLTDLQVEQFFNTVDIYYAPSRGEGFSIPVSMAAAAGKWPIVPAFGGPRDYLSEDRVVPGSFSPALAMTVYDPGQFWMDIDERAAIEKLQADAEQVRSGRQYTWTQECQALVKPEAFVHGFAQSVQQASATASRS